MIDAAIDKHIADHARSLPRLDSIIGEIRSAVASSQPLVVSHLKDWFVGHAIAHDAHLRPVFQTINSSTA
jgi:hemerythrin